MSARQVHPYVLAGGKSVRMGRDKALLPYQGTTLLEFIQLQLANIFGSATIVGPKERYALLGLPLVEDLHPGCGPLSGIEAALADCERADCKTNWALIVACDMPNLRNEPILEIAAIAESETKAKIVMPYSAPNRLEPLCAAYHRSILPIIRKSLESAVFKVTDAIEGIPRNSPNFHTFDRFSNVNTPAEWEALRG